MSYSQGSEEEIVLAYFGDREERFLEIGAWDGKCFSNCYALAERGWGGVCIEPDPEALEGLRRTHGDNPGIAIIGAALTDTDGSVTFHNSGGGGVSTTSDAHRDKWASASTFKTITVPSISIPTLLKMHPGPYPMLSVDVEGNSAELFAKLPLLEMGVELAVVEHDSRFADVLRHAARHGLHTVLYQSPENLILAR